MQKKAQVPEFLAPFLWSYDLSGLEIDRHKKLIIKNILDYGNIEATNWLESTYTRTEIQSAIQHTTESEWGRKSINFWSFIYDVFPKKTRF